MTAPAYPGMQQQQAIEFFVISQPTSNWGFHWFIEWHATSFYIKCRHPGIQAAKVSLHGPDPRPRHRGRQHLRYDLERDQRIVDRAIKAGAHRHPSSDPLPYYFTGRPVNDHAAHIVRFSAGWDTFVAGAPGPGGSDGLKPTSTFRALMRAPDPDYVAHVDVYLSYADPYWPNEQAVRDAQAGIGPITNSIGMNLTAVVAHRRVTTEPDPFGDLRGDAPLDQCTRSLAGGVDETDLLWLCEKVVPITDFIAPTVAGQR